MLPKLPTSLPTIIPSPSIKLPKQPSIPVVKQPKDEPGWVSPSTRDITEFSLPKQKFGNMGYLAHSFGAGRYFNELQVGDKIVRTDRQGRSDAKLHPKASYYKVKEVRRYQALEPENMNSPLLDLLTKETKSAAEVFDEIYGKNKVVFQTCLPKDGSSFWGRLFVIAE